MVIRNIKKKNLKYLLLEESIRRLNQDKGQNACISEFINAIKNSTQSPISFDEICDLHKFLFLANKKA